MCYHLKVALSEQNTQSTAPFCKSRNKRLQRYNRWLELFLQVNKIFTGQGDVCNPGFLLDYSCFKESYKLIAVNLSKQQKLDADQKVKNQIKFAKNIDLVGNKDVLHC